MNHPEQQHYHDRRRQGWYYVYSHRHNSVKTGLMSKAEARAWMRNSVFVKTLRVAKHPNCPKWWQIWR